MEKELNIAAILRDKPKGTKLYSKISGICTLKGVYDELYPIQVTSCKGGGGWNLMENGKYENEGECLIFPSKQMRDWSKFAWKRGDVLVYIDDEELYYAIFEAFQDDEYTAFKSRYNFSGGNHWLQFNSGSLTNHFAKASDDEAKAFIKKVEEHYGGKLNLSTLEIEKPQFKDGDIVTTTFLDDGTEMVCVFKEKDDEFYMGYCGVFTTGCFKQRVVLDFGEDCISEDKDCRLRLATDSEKQQLFDALAKEGKRWNAEAKTLEDLPKKYKFKTMDYFLARYNYSKDAIWNLYQYAYTDKDGYIFVVNESCIEADKYTCIPYNEGTKHLLGTNDDWKGGEG